MELFIFRDARSMSIAAAREVAQVLNAKPNAVLGMATGSTPLGLYQELVRMYARRELDFSHVTTFNLDEYVGLPVSHPQSYHQFMLATGKNKAGAVAAAVEGPVTSMITASALQMHPNTQVLLDEEAASSLKMRDYYDWVQEKKPNAPKV